MQNKKTITSGFMEARASDGEIWPRRRTAQAPPSMICQILRVILNACLTAMRRNTMARTMIAIYVPDYFKCRLMSLGIRVIVARIGREKNNSGYFRLTFQ
jgi:hypothetical protein